MANGQPEMEEARSFLKQQLKYLQAAKQTIRKHQKQQPKPLTKEWGRQHALLLQALTSASKLVEMARQEVAALETPNGGVKLPTMPTGGPTFTLSHTKTKKDCVDFFTRVESHLSFHQYPQYVLTLNDQRLHLWAGYLGTRITTSNVQDMEYLRTLSQNNLSWEATQAAFITRFARRSAPLQAAQQLSTLRQRAGQSAMAYAEEFERAVVATFTAEAPEDAQWSWHSWYTYAYLQGLNAPLLAEVLKDPQQEMASTSLKAAAALVDTVERRMATQGMFPRNDTSTTRGGNGNRSSKRQQHANTTSADDNHARSSEVKAGGDAHEGGGEITKDTLGAEKHKRSTCERCAKRGHTKDVCRSTFHKNGSKIEGKPPGSRPNDRPTKIRKCNTCGSEAHLAFACPSNPDRSNEQDNDQETGPPRKTVRQLSMNHGGHHADFDQDIYDREDAEIANADTYQPDAPGARRGISINAVAVRERQYAGCTMGCCRGACLHTSSGKRVTQRNREQERDPKRARWGDQQRPEMEHEF